MFNKLKSGITINLEPCPNAPKLNDTIVGNDISFSMKDVSWLFSVVKVPSELEFILHF